MDFNNEGLLNNHIRNLARDNAINTQLISMRLEQNEELLQNFEGLPQQLKTFFSKLFNSNKQKIQLDTILPFKDKKSRVPSCHKMLTQKSNSYRCYDCRIHSQSILCEECFRDGNHSNHRYIQLKEAGSCDCGCKNLLKKQGFCPNHTGEEQMVEINSNEEFMYYLYVRQAFIWILKLYKIGQSKYGDILLINFINYLTKLNELSLYYNKLTTNIFFCQSDPICNHLFYLSLNSSFKNKMIRAVINLFSKMLILRQFKQKLLTSLIINYNTVQGFETSNYDQFFYILFGQKDIVVSAMKKNPIPFRPERKFQITYYYSHLNIIKVIDQQAASAFLTPLLLVDAIKFPFLQKIQEKVQKGNDLIVTVFPEFQRQEYTYYNIMMAVIQVIDDKTVLAAMIRNYYLLTQSFSFRENKIILVPQRILVLLIFKYFDYSLKLINAYQLANILQIQKEQLKNFISQMNRKFFQCIFQFSMNLNRTTYFDNYLNIYINKNSQIICLDYLGIKISAILCGSSIFRYATSIIFQIDPAKMNLEEQERIEMFRAGNIFIKVLVQIISSPRTQLIVNAFLGRYNMEISSILPSIVKNISDITPQELHTISKVFNFHEISKQIITDNLNYDGIKKKYSIKSQKQCKSLNMKFMMSLLQTNFSKYVQNNTESQDYLQLNQSQQNLKNILLNCQTLQFIFSRQLQLIDDVKDHKLMMKELIQLVKTLRLAYKKQQEEFNCIFQNILYNIRQRYGYQDDSQNGLFVKDIYKISAFQKQTSKSSQSGENQSQKRKDLLKLKKQKMMNNKKMKENQAKFLSAEIQKQQSSQEMCLICRQSNDIEQMCYVAKMRVSNLLFNFIQINFDNIIFKSCYHTVHFDCFIKLCQNKETANCPLCKMAINLVLPMKNSYNQQLFEKISMRIGYILNYFLQTNETDNKKGFICEALCYFAYLFIANLENLSQINQKQLKTLCSITSLIQYNLSFQNKRQKAEAFLDNFLNKNTSNPKVRCYGKLVELIFHLFKWKQYSQIQIPKTIIEELSIYIKTTYLTQLVTIIDNVVSQPNKSCLHRILVAFQGIKKEPEEPVKSLQFIYFWNPPKDVENLLKLRDLNNYICEFGHQILVCTICHKLICYTCKKAHSHANQIHSKECLYFNNSNGGLLYFYKQIEISIRSLYIDSFQKIWRPQYEINDFNFDTQLYNNILLKFKEGILFAFLINTFEGLKGGNIVDIV